MHTFITNSLDYCNALLRGLSKHSMQSATAHAECFHQSQAKKKGYITLVLHLLYLN